MKEDIQEYYQVHVGFLIPKEEFDKKVENPASISLGDIEYAGGFSIEFFDDKAQKYTRINCEKDLYWLVGITNEKEAKSPHIDL